QQATLTRWLISRVQPDAPVDAVRFRHTLPDLVVATVQAVFQKTVGIFETHAADVRPIAWRLVVDQPTPLADVLLDLGQPGKARRLAERRLLGVGAGRERGGGRRAGQGNTNIGVQEGRLQPVDFAGVVAVAGRRGQQTTTPHAQITVGDGFHVGYSGC